MTHLVAPAPMCATLPRPPQGIFSWLASWTGKEAVPEPTLWEQTICLPCETPAAGAPDLRRGASLLG